MRPLLQSVRIKSSLSIGSDTAFDRTLAATSRELSEDIFSCNKSLQGCSLFFFYCKKFHPVLIKLVLLQSHCSLPKRRMQHLLLLMPLTPAFAATRKRNARRYYVLATLPRRKVEVGP